jgi:hypothetical protein
MARFCLARWLPLKPRCAKEQVLKFLKRKRPPTSAFQPGASPARERRLRVESFPLINLVCKNRKSGFRCVRVYLTHRPVWRSGNPDRPETRSECSVRELSRSAVHFLRRRRALLPQRIQDCNKQEAHRASDSLRFNHRYPNARPISNDATANQVI